VIAVNGNMLSNYYGLLVRLSADGILDDTFGQGGKTVADPLASVIVRQINSRKVFVLGAVGKQGPVVLTSDMTVLQLIALVGGLSEYADKKGIVVVRQENGREKRMKFNYNEVIEGKKLEQNIKLQPGDTVLVFD